MSNTVNIVALQELIAGLGARGTRNLHIRDESHENHIDYEIMTSDAIRRAMLAGNFGVLAVESQLTGEQRLRVTGSDGRIQLLEPDNRTEAAGERIRARHGAADADAFMADPQSFLNLWYQHERRAFRNATQVSQYAAANGIQLAAGDAERFLRIEPILDTIATDVAANEATITRINAQRDPERGGAVFLWGNWHTANDTPSIDMDTVYRGPIISIVANDAERTRQGNISDPAEYYFVADTGRIVDAQGREIPGLDAIRSAGRTAIASGQSQVPPTPAPTPTPVNTSSTDTPAPTSTTDTTTTTGDTGNQLGDMPWGELLGAGLGAWITSSTGNGIGRIFAMIVGALVGWLAGGMMTRGHTGLGAEEPQAEGAHLAASAQSEPSIAEQLNQPQITQALAFANVTSVTGGLPTDQADPSTLLDSPARVTPPLVSEQILAAY